MSYSSYSFTIGEDTPPQVDISALQKHIVYASNLSPIGVTMSDNVLEIVFSSVLSSSQETALNNALQSYVYTPPVIYDYVNYPLFVLNEGNSILSSGDATIRNNLTVLGTTNATNTTSGTLTVSGGVGIAKDLYANNLFIGNEPVATQTYVQSLLGSAVSGNYNFNTLILSGTVPSTSPTTGTLKVAGGIGIGGNLYVGNTMFMQGVRVATIDQLPQPSTNLTVTGTTWSVVNNPTFSGLVTAASLTVPGAATFSGTLQVPTPSSNNHAASKGYVDGLTYISAGTGLSKTGNVFSVNTTLPSVTRVGTLTELTVSGTTAFSGTVTVPPPINPTDAANKQYCDGLYQGLSIKASVEAASIAHVDLEDLVPGVVIDGVGLVSGNRVLLKDQNNPIENGIYQIGASRVADMNTGQDVSGAFTFVERGTVNASSGWVVIGTNATVIVGTDAIPWTPFSRAEELTAGEGLGKLANNFYVKTDNLSIEIVGDALQVSQWLAGTGLSGGSGVPLQVENDLPHVTSLGTLSHLTVAGATVVDSLVVNTAAHVATPSQATHATSKAYVDAISYITAGEGLDKYDSTLAVRSQLPHVTSVGTLTTLNVATTTSLNILNTAGLSTLHSLVVQGSSEFRSTVIVPSPLDTMHATTKGYVDGVSYITMGDGLVKTIGPSSVTLSVAPQLSHVTALGSLASLYIAGTTQATHLGDGALRVAGGAFIAKSLYIGGDSVIEGHLTLGSEPTLSQHAVSKSYVDNLGFLTIGAGLTMTNATLSVLSSQPTITELGTLTSLNVSGTVSITSTTPTVSATTGALIVTGGIGTSGSVYIGQNLVVVNDATFTGNVTVPTPSSNNEATNKSYVDGLSYVTVSHGIVKSGAHLSLASSQPTITSLGTLNGLTSSGTIIVSNTMNSTSSTTGAIVVAGGMGIGNDVYVQGALTVVGNAMFHAQVSVPTPTLSSSAVNKAYVDQLSYLTVGAGLSFTNGHLYLTNSQPTVTSLGTLTSLNVSGQVTLSSTLVSTSTTTGALVVTGGVGISGNLYVSQNAVFQSTTTFQQPPVVPTPAEDTHATSKAYVDGISYLLVGDGLVKTGSTVSLSPNQPTIVSLGILQGLSSNGVVYVLNTSVSTSTTSGALQVSGGMGIVGNCFVGGTVTAATPSSPNHLTTKAYVDGLSFITAGTGLSKTGNTFSVNATLTHVTQVGTLSQLSVGGAVLITATTAATSNSTGALRVSGGISSLGSLYIAGASTFESNVACSLAPTLSSHLTTKGYVDGLTYLTMGNGLVKSGGQVSVVSNLSHVTSLGTLTGLTSSGSVIITNTADSVSFATGALQVAGGMAVSKSILCGGTLSLLSTALSISATTGALVVSGGVGIQGNMTVAQTATFASSPNIPSPSLPNHAANKGYVDGLSYLTADVGLSLQNGTLSLNSIQTSITQVGTLTSLTSTGAAQFLSTAPSTSATTGAVTVSGGVGISGSLHVLSASSFSAPLTVAAPVTSSHATTKDYVDSLTYLSVGPGLAKINGVVSVQSTLGHVTSLGTLTSLSVQGTAVFSSTVTFDGTSAFNENVGFYSGADFLDAVTVLTPSQPNHAVNKAYVDALNYLIAGTGLTRVDNELRVNASLPHVVQVGTLQGLTSSGTLYVTATTSSINALSGALIVSGGVGIQGSLNVTGVSQFSSGIIVPSPSQNTHATNKSYVDSLSYLTAGDGIIKANDTLMVSSTLSHVTQVGTLITLGVSGAATFNGTVSVPTPILGTHAVNKDYVDNLALGLQVSRSVELATTGAVVLGSIVPNSLVDSIAVVLNDRILVKNQSNAVENGVYTVTSTGLVRASDFDLGRDVSGAYVLVERGQTNAASAWVVSGTTNSAVIGSDPIDWVKFSEAGQLNAGTAISIANNTVNVRVDTVSVEVYDNQLRVASGVAGTGLLGGSGVALSVNPILSHVTAVGTLTGLTVSGSTSLTSLTTAGATIVPTPTASTHATTKAYVDGISYITAGTGLTKSVSTLSVNAALTHVTSVGTLTGLTSSGVVSITNTSAATSTTSGALRVSGGMGLGGALHMGGVLTSTSASASSFTGAVSVGAPTLAGHATTKTYVDGLSYITAGTGLTKSGSTLSVNASLTHVTSVGTLTSLTVSGNSTAGSLTVSGLAQLNQNVDIAGTLTVTTAAIVPTPTLATHATSKGYVDSLSYLSIGAGLSLSNGTLSINVAQPTVTSLGTLTSLSVAGNVGILSTTSSTSVATGALTVAGGVGIVENVFVGGTLAVTGAVTVPSPQNANDATTKSYVDGISYLNVGSGLDKTGSTLSVRASLSHVTSVGTLTSLVVSGNTTTASLGATTATIGDAIVQGNLTVQGALVVPIAPINSNEAVSKAYVDGFSYATAGTGLVKSGSTLSVSPLLSHVTSVGTLSSLQVSGVVQLTATTVSSSTTTGSLIVSGGVGIAGNVHIGSSLSVNGTCSFTGAVVVPTPLNSDHATTKGYVDALTYLSAGNGLTKTGSTLSVNANQSGITTVGVLTSLGVSGNVTFTATTLSTSTSTGALVVTGGVGVGGSLFVGGASTFSIPLTIATPTAATHATTKSYVDGLSYVTAGNGVSRSGSTLSTTSSQTHVTQLGTLTSLIVSGTTSITSSAAGALTLTGGMSVGGPANFSTVQVSTTLTVPTPVNSTDAVTKAYVDGITYVSAGTGLTKIGNSFNVNSSQPSVTSLGILNGLTVAGNVAITVTTASTSTTTGALTVAGGVGIAGALHLGTTPTVSTHATSKGYVDGLTYLSAGTGLVKSGSTLSVSASQSQITSLGTLTGLVSSGEVSVTNTSASVSVTTGALVVAGGVGIGGDVYASGLLYSDGVRVATLNDLTTSSYTAGTNIQINSGVISVVNAPTFSGQVTVSNTVDSTSTTTGAMVVSGGVAVAKTLTLGASVTLRTVTVSSGTTLSSSHCMVALNSASTGFNVTLPSATTSLIGRIYRLFKISTDSNSVYIVPASGQTIGGSTSSWELKRQYAFVELTVTASGQWQVVSQGGQPSVQSIIASGSGAGIFAAGSTGVVDGDVVIGSNTTLTRDMYYNNLTINSGVTLDCSGWRVIVFGILQLEGKIANEGEHANQISAGNGASSNYIGGGSSGANGRTSDGNGSNASSSLYYCTGGRGGNGGNGSGSRIGGQGANVSSVPSWDGGVNVLAIPPYNTIGRIAGSTLVVNGGTGGGSGGLVRGSAWSTSSGGGGGGGGICIVCARVVQGNGTVSANGGNGGNASIGGGLSGSTAIGGGGGGGGGTAILIFQVNNSNVTVTANGGNGGNPIGNGQSGDNGENGRVYVCQL